MPLPKNVLKGIIMKCIYEGETTQMKKNIVRFTSILALPLLLLVGCSDSTDKEEASKTEETILKETTQEETNAEAVSKDNVQNKVKEKTSSEENADIQEQTEEATENAAVESTSSENQKNLSEEEAKTTTATSQTATSEQYNYMSYENTRFGFIVQYPDTFKAGRAPDNGDGLGFSNGEAEISAYGSFDVFEDNLQSYYEFATDDVVGPIALQKRGDDYFIVSFVDANDNIVYQKSNLQAGVISTVRLTYPASQKEKYDELVNHVVDTFVPSSGDR